MLSRNRYGEEIGNNLTETLVTINGNVGVSEGGTLQLAKAYPERKPTLRLLPVHALVWIGFAHPGAGRQAHPF